MNRIFFKGVEIHIGLGCVQTLKLESIFYLSTGGRSCSNRHLRLCHDTPRIVLPASVTRWMGAFLQPHYKSGCILYLVQGSS